MQFSSQKKKKIELNIWVGIYLVPFIEGYVIQKVGKADFVKKHFQFCWLEKL